MTIYSSETGLCYFTSAMSNQPISVITAVFRVRVRVRVTSSNHSFISSAGLVTLTQNRHIFNSEGEH